MWFQLWVKVVIILCLLYFKDLSFILSGPVLFSFSKVRIACSGDNTEKIWTHRFLVKQKNFPFFGEKTEKNSVCEGESTTKDNTTIVFFKLLGTFETRYGYIPYSCIENLTQTKNKKSVK